MAFNYARARKTATRLIKNFGQLGSVRKPPAYAPQQVWLVVVDYASSKVDGTQILASDRLIYVEAKVEVTTDDRLATSDGTEYEVISVNTLNPAGTTVLYECQGRI